MNEAENDATPTILTLALSASDISSIARGAALEFMNQGSRWGTGELSTWLTGPYAMLTQHAAKSEGGMWAAPLLRSVDARLVDRIVKSARTEVLETLRRMNQDGSATFVLKSLLSGFVVRCEDALREPAWAPTGDATRLADRVLSLFAVDYLMRPGDYESELYVCPTCEAISFNATTRERDLCYHHVAPSATQARLTLPYPPLEAGGAVKRA